jgi:probable HAF family extracellular repeat protein
MKNSMKLALSSAAAAACLLSTTGAQATVYRITEITGATTATITRAFDINNLGQVVGYTATSATATANDRAFVWDGVNGLQTLTGTTSFASHAYAINDVGQITGDYRTATGATSARAFRWTQGSPLQNLGNYSSSATQSSVGRGINDTGTVVGSSGTMGMVWGTPKKTFAGQAWDVNDSGLTVGTSGGQAVTYNGTATTNLGMLPTFNTSSVAYGVNDAGWTVGRSEGSANYAQAFMWNGTTMQGLGDLEGGYQNSTAYDINNKGQVVGFGSVTTSSDASRAFIWDATNGMVDLNTLIDPADPMYGGAFRLIEAQGINDLGQIVGYGVFGRTEHAFLLTPVPEPHQYGMMLAGLGMVGWMVRRRRSAGGSFGALAA